MNRVFLLFAGALLLLAANHSACSQTAPVTDNLWRLAAQADTDGDEKITAHEFLTPEQRGRLRSFVPAAGLPLAK
jgi:hypothetical protein